MSSDDPRNMSGSEGGLGFDGPAVTPRAHVLLVEDHADAREAVRTLLELDGYHVEVAASGAEAIELARATAPDVAVVDIGLPGMDGYEIARRMAALEGEVGHRPLLIALTGYGSAEDRRRATEAGFAAHLVKPVDPAELSRLLAAIRGTLPPTG